MQPSPVVTDAVLVRVQYNRASADAPDRSAPADAGQRPARRAQGWPRRTCRPGQPRGGDHEPARKAASGAIPDAFLATQRPWLYLELGEPNVELVVHQRPGARRHGRKQRVEPSLSASHHETQAPGAGRPRTEARRSALRSAACPAGRGSAPCARPRRPRSRTGGCPDPQSARPPWCSSACRARGQRRGGRVRERTLARRRRPQASDGGTYDAGSTTRGAWASTSSSIVFCCSS